MSRPSLKGKGNTPEMQEFLRKRKERYRVNKEKYIKWLSETRGFVTLNELFNPENLKKAFITFRLCGIINSNSPEEIYILISDTAKGHLTLTSNLKMTDDPKDFIKFDWNPVDKITCVSPNFIDKRGEFVFLGQNEKEFFADNIDRHINKLMTENPKLNYSHQYIYDGNKLTDVGNDIKLYGGYEGSFIEMFRYINGLDSITLGDDFYDIEIAERKYLE